MACYPVHRDRGRGSAALGWREHQIVLGVHHKGVVLSTGYHRIARVTAVGPEMTMDLSDRHNRRAYLAALYEKKPFCVWLDDEREIHVGPRDEVPKGAFVTFTAEPSIQQ